jgi:uncharacterized metal-binding protein YceD (DUF177 family)
MKSAPPIERLYDLATLFEAGDEVQIAASADDLTRLADWAGVDRVERFEGKVSLRKLSPARFAYDAVLSADVVQPCVVTLEPVKSHIARSFARTLHYSPGRPVRDEGQLTLAAGDDEAPDEIASTRFDLAGPLLEEFSLAIDPYPRVPGVAFEPPKDARSPEENPFAVLKRLKEKGG